MGLLDQFGEGGKIRGLLSSPDAMQYGLLLAANSGYSPRRKSVGEIAAQSLLQQQQMKQQQEEAMLQRQYREAQIAQMREPKQRRPVVVAGPDGKPVYVDEQNAIGQSPYLQPQGSASDSSMIQEWKASGEPDYFKFLQKRSRMVNPPTLQKPDPTRYVSTPNGTMRVAPDGTETILPETKPLEPQGRPIPQGLAGDLKGNAQVINMIDQVVPMLNTTAGKRATGARNAVVGMVLPDAIADNAKNVFDPKGTEVRAIVSNLNSFVVKERSGAAVTVQEFARQRGFLPTDADNTEVIKTKLGKLRKALIDENAYIADFAESQGYRRPPTGVNRGLTVYPNGSPEAARADSALRGGSNESDPLGLR